MFESGGGVYEKLDLPETFHKFGRESGRLPFPSKKNEFGIGRDVISRCVDGCTCTLQSLLS